jgi:diguanylate cyclase
MENKHLTNDADVVFEKLLCKIILQFAFYTQGGDEQLNPHTAKLIASLKGGFKPQRMKPELQALSRTLIKLNKASKSSSDDHSVLFDYLLSEIHKPETKDALTAIRKRQKNGEFASNQALIDAIKRVVPPGVAETADEQKKSPNKDILLSRLDLLLDKIDIPAQFDFRAQQLKQCIQRASTDTSYLAVVEDIIKFLLNINNLVLREQSEVERFLAQVSSQLGDVEEHAAYAVESNQASIDNRVILNSAITEQVENLMASSSDAQELTSLKHSIHGYLAQITQHLNDHKHSEDLRQIEAQKKLDEMAQKVQDMEKETILLKSNLKLAHDKAMHDPLTSLPNRLAFDERIEVEEARWLRYQSPLAIIIWDIDHFKAVNDNYGHKAGDKALILIAQLLRNNCRETDFIARFGGEEFVMLLPSTDKNGAFVLADKIRKTIEQSGFNSNGSAIKITISCGISEFVDQYTHEEVFEQADQALYKAKEQGRNCCIVSHLTGQEAAQNS